MGDYSSAGTPAPAGALTLENRDPYHGCVMEEARRVPRLVADFALLAVAAAWGLTFPLGKIVLASLPPFTYLAVRFTIAAVILGITLPGRRHVATPQRAWTTAVAVGMVLFVAYALQTVGLRLTSASNSGFITGLSVAMVPLMSAVWLRGAPRPAVLAGVAAATAGLGLLTLNDPAPVRLGDLLTLGCAAGFALHIVLIGRLARTLDHVTLATAQIVPVALLSALAALTEHPLPALAAADLSLWGIIAFMALTGTVAAFLIQTWAQRFTSASHTGLMFAFEPVAAALAAHALLAEVLTGLQAVGAGLILAGIVAAELKQDAGNGHTGE